MERFDYAIILCSFQIDFRWPEMTRPSSQKSALREWDTRSFLGVPSAISSFFDIEGRRFSIRRWRLPSRAAQWEAALMRKLAKILEQSSGMRQVCLFFFSVYCIKRLDSMLPWVCSVIHHGRRQTVDKKIICGKDTTQWHTRPVFTTFWSHLGSITEQTYGNMESIC